MGWGGRGQRGAAAVRPGHWRAVEEGWGVCRCRAQVCMVRIAKGVHPRSAWSPGVGSSIAQSMCADPAHLPPGHRLRADQHPPPDLSLAPTTTHPLWRPVCRAVHAVPGRLPASRHPRISQHRTVRYKHHVVFRSGPPTRSPSSTFCWASAHRQLEPTTTLPPPRTHHHAPTCASLPSLVPPLVPQSGASLHHPHPPWCIPS
jgi:hypothetical protein